MQTFERLPWSRISERGRIVAARAMFASPVCGTTTARSFGFFARRVAPKRRKKIFGLKSSFSQPLVEKAAETGLLEKAPGVGRVGAAAEQRAAEAARRAARRVEREFVPVELHRNRADVERRAAVDVRDRVGLGPHLGGARVDAKRHPHHDRAEIERPGRGGGDHRQGERCALIWACEEDLAGDLDRRRAAAGGYLGLADQARVGTARVGRLVAAADTRRRGQHRLRAVVDALQLRGQPRRQRDVDPFQLLVAVGAPDVHVQRAVSAGLLVGGARLEARVERPVAERLRAGAAAGEGGQREVTGRRRRRVAAPGRHRRGRLVRPAGAGAGEHRVVAVVEVEREGAEGDLRQALRRLRAADAFDFAALEGRRQLAAGRVGADLAFEAHEDPVALRERFDEDPVLLARGRVAAELLTDVDGAGQRAVGQRRRVDRDAADPRGRRAAVRFVVRAEPELGVGAGLQAAAGGRRVEPHAGWQRHLRPLGVGAVLFVFFDREIGQQVRHGDLDVGARGRVGLRGAGTDRDRRFVGNRGAAFGFGPRPARFALRGDRRLEERGAVGEVRIGFADRIGAQHGGVDVAGRPTGLLARRPAVRVGGPEAGGRRRQEGAVAGAAVEDEAIFQDQPLFAGKQAEDAPQAFGERRGHMDGEALVVVAGPVDVAFEEDFAAGEFEAEAGRLALLGFDVVDRHFGQRRRRRRGNAQRRQGDGDLAFADFGFRVCAGAVSGPRFEDRERAALRRPRVDAEADRQVDSDRLQFVNRGFAGGFVLDDELGEAPVGVGAGGVEELRGSGDRAERRARFGRFGLAGAGLPAGAHRRMSRVAGGDDAARVGECRRRAESHSQSQEPSGAYEPYPRSRSHPELLPLDHLPNILPDFDDVR